uniref:Uncharacterized protein n=1 Tax=Anolis carolinensis TaxID=28377 RepID=A0A803SKL8_ANOCA
MCAYSKYISPHMWSSSAASPLCRPPPSFASSSSTLLFWARALEDLPDLAEYASINWAVPQMPTVMEKEERSRSVG